MTSLSQDDIKSIADAVAESMDERILALVKLKMQLSLGIDCTDNDDLIKTRKAIEFADEMRRSTETFKSRAFYGLWGLCAAIVIAVGGAWANHTLSK